MALTQERGGRRRAWPTTFAVLTLLATLLVLPLALAPRADAYIYWTNGYGPIGRANLNGSRVDSSFITTSAASAASLGGIAVDASHIYWSQTIPAQAPGDSATYAIGRANLDGSDVQQAFITGADRRPGGIAVDSLTGSEVAGKASATRTQRQADKGIIVRVRVKAKERLTAKASGKIKVNPAYKLKPKKQAQAKRITGALKRGKKATARVEVKLTDQAGNNESERLGVRLKR